MDKKHGHALLSPSGSARWLACTPSAILESYEPEQPSSTFAQEGTDAHTLAELKLLVTLEQIGIDEYETRFEHFKTTTDYYNEEFEEYVDAYVDEVMTIINTDYEGQDVQVHLEVRVHFEDVVPGGSGTSDVVIIGKDFVHVIDLKFGKGVAVSAIDNTQLRLYALGALHNFRLHGPFKDVRMTIVQPRLYDITTDHVSVVELNDWAINYVKPRALMASRGEGELNPGDHCKFCKLRGKCEALGQMQLDLAMAQFDDAMITVDNEPKILEPQEMTPDMLAKIMTIGPKFVDWFKDVQVHAKKVMLNEDVKVPGYKIVEGRSRRILTNPPAIAEKLRTAGYPITDYLKEPELLGITALEKNIGKKLLDSLVGDYIIKPAGSPTVVPDTDRRTALDAKQFRLSGQEFDEIEVVEED